MGATNILKPKSKKQAIEDFCRQHNMSDYDLKEFRKKLNFIYGHKIFVWVVCLLGCIFGLSMIINGITAMSKKYFWFPVHEAKSMISFFNIFWGITWYVIGFAIILYCISILVDMNETS